MGQASAEDDMKRYELLKDFNDSGKLPEQQLSFVELCQHLETRIKQIAKFDRYTLLEEEKKTIDAWFKSSVDKNNDGLASVYVDILLPRQDIVNGYVEYLAFSNGRQRDLQRRVADFEHEIATLGQARVEAQVHGDTSVVG